MDAAEKRTGSVVATWGDRDLRLVVVAGVLYVVAIACRDWLSGFIGIPSRVTTEYLRHFGTLHVLGNLALRLPAISAIGVACLAYRRGHLHASMRAEPVRLIVWTVSITLAVSFVLNLFGWWPFMWRWVGAPTRPYLAALISGAQWGGLALWALLAVFVTPVIEELVFRFAILQAVRSWTGSDMIAVLSSSVLFAVGHLGYLPPDVPHAVNAVWLFAASLVLGRLTIRRGGKVTLSLVAHVARNALELLILVVVAWPAIE